MRDHRQLKAFHLADAPALNVYRATAQFPRHELYGLASQMRRAAVSAASNIVEGCARHGEADYLRFLDVAYGSACELQYQASVALRLGYLQDDNGRSLVSAWGETAKVLNGLIAALRRPTAEPEA